MVARLKPSRTARGAAEFGAGADPPDVRPRRQQIRTANVVAFNLPPIIGLSTSGGFEYQLEALRGPATRRGWAA